MIAYIALWLSYSNNSAVRMLREHDNFLRLLASTAAGAIALRAYPYSEVPKLFIASINLERVR